MVSVRARERAFPLLVGDVKEKLADDPQVLKDLRRFYREGTFDEGGRVTLPDVKDHLSSGVQPRTVVASTYPPNARSCPCQSPPAFCRPSLYRRLIPFVQHLLRRFGLR